MSARKAATKSKPRPPKPGQGNPHWGRSYVTASYTQNFTPDKDVKKAPLSLSAGSRTYDRVQVTVGQGGYLAQFGLEIEIGSGPKGWKVLEQCVTLKQLYAFEEAVRAVFRAAREEGILAPSKDDQSWATREEAKSA